MKNYDDNHSYHSSVGGTTFLPELKNIVTFGNQSPVARKSVSANLWLSELISKLSTDFLLLRDVSSCFQILFTPPFETQVTKQKWKLKSVKKLGNKSSGCNFNHRLALTDFQVTRVRTEGCGHTFIEFLSFSTQYPSSVCPVSSVQERDAFGV